MYKRTHTHSEGEREMTLWRRGRFEFLSWNPSRVSITKETKTLVFLVLSRRREARTGGELPGRDDKGRSLVLLGWKRWKRGEFGKK